MTEPVIGFAGMTHLGLVSAAAAAARGFPVVAYDPDPGRIEALAAGQLGVAEPGLDEIVAQHRDRLRFSSALASLSECDVVYVSLDVPTDDQGISDLDGIDRLLVALRSIVRPDAGTVILSQVPPGFTRRHIWAGRLFYQVETLIFGRAVERATSPERIILGTPDQQTELPQAFARFLSSFECPVLRMRYESAELAKIAINCFLVSSVCTTNMLAELCEGVGADWGEIAPALRLDQRIGRHAYLSPGLGIAGGNLERDLATLRSLGGSAGSDTGIVNAWRANSIHRQDWPLRMLYGSTLRHADPLIAILGLAYKENTNSTKNSAAIRLVRQLLPFRLRVFDPSVGGETISFHDRAEVSPDALSACRDADALCIMTPWPMFRALQVPALAQAMRGRVIIDPYGMIDSAAAQACGFDHNILGRRTVN